MKIFLHTLGTGLLYTCFVIATPQKAWSQGADMQNVCAAAAMEAERILGIPAYLLQAIALTESGRWVKKQKRQIPWPWAVGAQKKSWYFDTKAEAVAHIENLQKQGVTNIDVGCMQINLHYHGHTFKDLQEAFHPINNIAYAGIFLSELFRLKKSWNEAVKFYHSANPKFNRRYIQVVYESWQKLREQAKGGVVKPDEVGLRAPKATVAKLPDKEDNVRLPDDEENRKTQTILLSAESKKKQEEEVLKDIIRYDAFARVVAAQQLSREFDLNLENVPPPILAPEDLLETIEEDS